MIRIDRSRVPMPPILRSPRARKAREKQALLVRDADRTQSKPVFDPAIIQNKEVRSALRGLFNDKCAYCETRVGAVSFGAIDHFRPKWQAMDLDGGIHFSCYWWLAYEWTNLYSACQICNQNKGSRFPVAGRRALKPGDSLPAEEPLLLDPCSDDPDDHLVFDEAGVVSGLSERGTITIQVFDLNRGALVESRKSALVDARRHLFLTLASNNSNAKNFTALLGPDRDFLGARRQLFRTWLKQAAAATTVAQTEETPKTTAAARAFAANVDAAESIALAQALPEFSDDDRDRAKEKLQEAQRSVDEFTLSETSKKDKYFARARYIERIEIRNFKGIESLDLVMPTQHAGTGWLMLLGENATGKSSVLQAVVLTLIGEQWRSDLIVRNKLDTRRYLRHGATEGSVRVFLTGALEPEEMVLSNTSSSSLSGGGAGAKVAILGYGSTRLPPGRLMSAKSSFDLARVDNLFNPFEPLNDADEWLTSLDDQDFDHVARALRSLLPDVGEGRFLFRTGGKVQALVHGEHRSLDELSDGYQSVIALATDVMRVMLANGWQTMETAEGVVLLDEIGAHLHPRWCMRIVTSLRTCFPRIQFLATTHDPLCLRGLQDGEVAVMRRTDRHETLAITDLPSVRGLRVDQLLTSEFFSLDSTIDPDLEKLFTEYYELLAVTRPSADQKARLKVLRGDLDKHKVMGADRRERMMLETIDEFLAQERSGDDAGNRELRAGTKKKLREIWHKVAPTPVGRNRRH